LTPDGALHLIDRNIKPSKYYSLFMYILLHVTQYSTAKYNARVIA